MGSSHGDGIITQGEVDKLLKGTHEDAIHDPSGRPLEDAGDGTSEVEMGGAPPLEGRVKVYPVRFKELELSMAPPGKGIDENLRFMEDVPLEIRVELGGAEMTVGDLARLEVGRVLKIEKGEGEPVGILVGEELVAEGEVLVVGDQLAVRVTAMIGQRKKN